MLLIFLSIVWGSSFILIKKALISFTPLEVGSARIAVSFMAFLPLFIIQYAKIPWHKWRPLLVVGLCGSGFPAFLYAIGQTHIPSAVAGVLNSMTPIFTFLLAVTFFKAVYKRNQLLGILMGLLGILLLFFIRQEGGVSMPLGYTALIILATVFYAISANTVGRYLKDVKPLMISIISFVFIGPWVLMYLASTDFFEKALDTSQHGWSLLALIILSLIGTFLANILFFKLVQITDAIFSTTVSFLIPFVALFWGFIDGERITIWHFLALIMILFGIYMIKYSSKKS